MAKDELSHYFPIALKPSLALRKFMTQTFTHKRPEGKAFLYK